MAAQGRGVITVGSTAGQLTMSNYSAIKAWANSYSQALSNELRGTGVTATLVMPGWVSAEFHDRAGIGARSGFLLARRRPRRPGRPASHGRGRRRLHPERALRRALLAHARHPDAHARGSPPSSPRSAARTRRPWPHECAGDMSYDRFTSRFQAGVRFAAQRGVLKPLVWSLVSVRVHGRERLKGLGGFVLVANHSSHLDAPLLFGSLPRPAARYLAAGAASDYFFDVAWRKWLTTLVFNAFAVERNAEGKRSSQSRALGPTCPSCSSPRAEVRAGSSGRSSPAPPRCRSPRASRSSRSRSSGQPRHAARDENWPVRGRPRVDVVIGDPVVPLEGSGRGAERPRRGRGARTA